MKRTMIISITLLMTVWAFSVPASAQWTLGPLQKQGMSSASFIYESIIEENTANYYLKYRDMLGLSEDQISEIRKMRLEDLETEHEFLKNFNIANQELTDLLEKEDPDIEEVENKIREIGKLRSDYEIAKFRSQLRMRKKLTPEQVDTLIKLIQESNDKGFVSPYKNPIEDYQRYQKMKEMRGY